MSLPPVLALRDAVLALIKAVPEVSGPCKGRIHDAVPITAPVQLLPAVSLGPALQSRGENGADPLGMMRLRIFVASNEPKRDEAWKIAYAIERALEGKQPDLSGEYSLIDVLRITQTGDVLDKLAPTEVFLDVTTIVQRD